MRRRRMTTLVIIASLLLASGQALAQLPTFRSGQVLTADQLNAIVRQVNRNASAAGSSGGGATHTVDCASGTISAAMARASAGDTIRITGTCNEAVVVDKDGITLDGGGAAVIDGGAVDATALLIKGQQNVTIKGLTVQKGLHGIGIVEGAAAWLENVTVRGSRAKEGHDSSLGILVADSSVAVLTGAIVANDNAGAGVVVWGSSMAYVAGNIVVEGDRLPQASLQANGNGYAGIEVGTSSALHVFSGDRVSTTVQANNNSGHGISVVQGASAQFGGGADVEATGNGKTGLDVANGSSVVFVVYGAPLRGVAARFNKNKEFGILVWNTSSLVLGYNLDAGATITATDNVERAGLAVGLSSTVIFQVASSQLASASLVFSRNGSHGVAVWQNSTVNFRMPAEIKNNAKDGVHIWASCFVELGIETPGDGVVVADNGANGVRATHASDVAIGNATIEDNAGHGIGIYDNGFLHAFGGPMIIDNGEDGISAWNGVGVYLSNATVTGNTEADVDSGRGSRLGWSGSTVGTVACDADVLTFDDAACPGR